MFVYLSKKIAIPNNVKLNCIAWNKEHGYIAVAGSEGLLKVLKLEQASSGPNKGNLAAVSNLSMNQTLDGHKEGVKVVTWNESQQKLTSSDLNGVIMVWMIYKGSWYEEMTNDRKKSTVNSMCWTSDGAKICIVYEDGAIIVGSVDGNRIWGKELRNTHLTSVQWSPDNRLILFGLANGECHLYDNQGNFAMKLNIQCVSLSPNRNFKISALCWYSGRAPSNRPVLAICFETCKLQIMRNESDDAPVIIDTGMRNIAAEWNQDGSVLSVCGMLIDYNTSKESNQVNFYSPFGHLIRTLKVPGNEISSLSWEGKSLRIAMAVDSFIYFANIRPDYMWCYFEKTVVFLNKNSTNHTRNSTTNVITFWNTVSNQSFLKEVEPALGMAACNDHCVLAVECLNSNMKENIVTDATNPIQNDDKCYQLMLCNSIGTTVDSKYTDMKPNFIAINSGHVAIASFDEVLIWHYNTPKSAANLHGAKGRKENRFHIDDTPTGVEMAKDLVIATGGASYDKKAYKQHVNIDPICALAMSEKILLVARSSGTINEYSVPNVALRNRLKINARPYKMSINCNSSRAAVIDDVGVMTLLDLDDDRQSQLNFNRVERKDVWAVCWAKDNPLLLALMEKTRMYVFRGNDPEEPISCSGYICAFEDLEITSVLLDDIISGDESQNSVNHIIQLRVKSLRDTDDLLHHVGLEDAKQFIEDNPHPRLWRLLAEAALKKLELGIAENAFVRCANYQGIQLIKRMRNISTPMLQKAEVAAFYGEYEEAEKLYMDADRRDLAINLRITLCDWFRAVQLYRMGSGVSDQQMETAWREIGNHFASLRSWESAKEYYEKSHHLDGLMDALYHLERFDELEQCIDKLPEKSPLLAKIAEMLASVGMCTEAVKAYLKMGDPKSAVNACVNLRQWGEAVQLARKFDMPQIGDLLSKHAAQLIKEDRLPEAIELQKKAGFYLEAARLLGKLAQREAEKDSSMLRIKKLYILASLLSEEHLKSLSTVELSYKVDRNSILDTMSPEDAHVVEHMWHAAEAYHFMMLAQRQLRFGITRNAVATALRLCDYDDILPAEDVYNILALSCCADRSFGTCVKAFTKLEGSLESIPECRVQEYKRLAESIFSKYTSEDTKREMVKCYACNSPLLESLPACSICGARFPACVSSGKPITQPTSNIWICGICHHCATPVEISRHHTCPLCHSLIISMTVEI
ncbi:WD repeat-containing protein 35 isoform X2 [Bactrocera oleae]|uniref:WD repeat-containing protein 35 isoform X2 n=1 Tax=Bactrocera oleae TaxID=104688 RepID=UPI0006B7BD17